MLSKQHKRAFLKRSAINLIALFTYNIKTALMYNKKVTMFTFNIQRTFDTMLKKRLLRYITKQD
jgi:hypothetical protein